MPASLNALVVEHERNTPLGRLEPSLAEHGVAVHVVRPEEGDAFPDPRGYDLVVPLGSDASAYDDAVPWVRAELAWLQDAIRARVPVLGICFGGQILARALGAEVRRAGEPEMGWSRLERTVDWVPEGPFFAWHADTFAWPPGSARLAWTDHSPQAFAHGPHLGLQFHPEADAAIIEGWIDDEEGRLLRDGIDVDAVRETTRRLDGAAAAAARNLFAAYLTRALRGRGRPSP